MTENEFLLADRVQKIQSLEQSHKLTQNAYVSFSGGKDSTVLSKLIDIALPDNNIPRVFCNTGIEYKATVSFVRSCAEKDSRVVLVPARVDIKAMLKADGYPFKSKEHAHKVHLLQNGSKAPTVLNYFGLQGIPSKRFQCPKILLYQRENKMKFPISDLCCERLKKQPLGRWSRENNKQIAITGIRRGEGGQRANVKNCLFYAHDKLRKFSPLLPCSDSFVDFMIKKFEIQLSPLYGEPYNFRRTGCKGCPFNIELQKELDTLERYFPSERKACEMIFGTVYDEYRRIGFRLEPLKSSSD